MTAALNFESVPLIGKEADKAAAEEKKQLQRKSCDEELNVNKCIIMNARHLRIKLMEASSGLRHFAILSVMLAASGALSGREMSGREGIDEADDKPGESNTADASKVWNCELARTQ